MFWLWGGRGFGNGFGNGGDCCANGLPAQLNNDYGRELLMQAIQGNRSAIDQIASALNCSTTQLQNAICNVQGAIDKVAGQVGMTSQAVINAVQQQGCEIGNQISSCCCNLSSLINQSTCQTQGMITQQGFDNQLRTLEQTNILQNGLNQGLANNREQATSQFNILSAKLDAQTVMINDKFCQLEMREMQNTIAQLREEKAALTASALSQQQTQNICVSQETLTCGSNTVLYAVTDTTGVSGKDVFDKDVWVAFPDSNYAVQLYATTGVTKEEIEKIAEDLSLTPSDKETAELWSGEPQEEATGGTDEVYKVADYTIQQIGDTIRSDFYDDDDKYSRVTVKLDSVSVQDNFDGLPAVDDIGNPVDYSQYLNADGTVKDDVRTWYSRGDGVNTLDEKVKEETVPQRVLVMHLSYTNESSITQEICVCPNLLQKNGDRLDYGAVACEPTDETMYCNGTLDDLKYGEFFLFTTDRDHSKNNITNVAPGETVEATVAFLMDADELQDLYADILGSGQKTIVSLGDLQ